MLYDQEKSWNGSTTTAIDYLSWQDTVAGNNVPEWERLIKEGLNASSDYARTGVKIEKLARIQYDAQLEVFIGKKYPVSSRLERWVNFLPGSAPSHSQSVYEIALGNMLANANELASPLKGQIFLGELRKTLNMIRRPASALRDSFSQYLNKAFLIRKRRVRPVRVLADTYLEYLHGWTPLFYDVKRACQAYKDLQATSEYGRAFGKGSNKETVRQDYAISILPAQPVRVEVSKSTTTSSSCKWIGVCRYAYDGIQAAPATRLQRLAGFRWEEFTPTLWELLPYSWVVDYFTNVGTILNGYHALDFAWRWTSCSQDARTSVSVSPKCILGKSRWLSNERDTSVPGVASRIRYNRSSPPVRLPLLVLKLPSSNWQWGALAALIQKKAF